MFLRADIEDFLSNYSPDDRFKVEKDLTIVEKIAFDEAEPHTDPRYFPTYLATAGGPGTAKSTTLETFIKDNHLEHFVYIDPDQVCLKNMNFTYRKSLTNYSFALAKSNHEALKNAYEQWRAASNYICHEILQRAFGNIDGKGEKYSVAHGTTSTSPHIESLYSKLQAQKYHIKLLLCYSSDTTRKTAIETREKEQAFVQTDPQEIISKGADFAKRFDIYFNYADEIFFYWNNDLTHGRLPSACAKVTKNNTELTLTVLNEVDWEFFCKQYLQDIQQHDIKPCQRFEALIPKHLWENASMPVSSLSSPLYNMGLYGANSNSSKYPKFPQDRSLDNFSVQKASLK
jgi:hypothetical protein